MEGKVAKDRMNICRTSIFDVFEFSCNDMLHGMQEIVELFFMECRLNEFALPLPMGTFCSQESAANILGQIAGLNLTFGVVALILLKGIP